LVSGDALKAERHLGCEEAWVNNVAPLPFAASQSGLPFINLISFDL
jgi:hypothetical protein